MDLLMTPENRETVDKIIGGYLLVEKEIYLDLLDSTELPVHKKQWLLHTIEDLRPFPPDDMALQYILEQLFFQNNPEMKRASVTTMKLLNPRLFDKFRQRLIGVESHFLSYVLGDVDKSQLTQ